MGGILSVKSSPSNASAVCLLLDTRMFQLRHAADARKVTHLVRTRYPFRRSWIAEYSFPVPDLLGAVFEFFCALRFFGEVFLFREDVCYFF